MDGLDQLLDLAPRERVQRRLQQSRSGGEERTMLERLYDLLSREEISQDRAARELYGPDAAARDGRYRALKARLRRVLIDTIVLQDGDGLPVTTYIEAVINGPRIAALARVLAVNRAYQAARDMLHQLYKKVRHFEIIPLNRDLTYQLMSLYLGVNYNEELYTRYATAYAYYSEALRDYDIINLNHKALSSMLYGHEVLPEEIAERAEAFTQVAQPIVDKYPKSSLIQMVGGQTAIMALTLRGNYTDAVPVLKEVVSRIRQSGGYSQHTLDLLLMTRIDCAVKAEDFPLARDVIASAQQQISLQTINGLNVTEQAVRLGLHYGEYVYAAEQLMQAQPIWIRRLLTPKHIEFWTVLEAYLQFLYGAGSLPEDVGKQLRKFRVQRFLNEVPHYARNKRGMNVQILVIQTIWFIVRKQYGRVLDRAEALERYCSRYLRYDSNLRDNCFLQLLLITARCNFHRGRTERETRTIYRRMTTPKAIELCRANSTELIPYEQLWEIVLRHLSVELVDRRSLNRVRYLGTKK